MKLLGSRGKLGLKKLEVGKRALGVDGLATQERNGSSREDWFEKKEDGGRQACGEVESRMKVKKKKRGEKEEKRKREDEV